jgi:hypothetical protein
MYRPRVVDHELRDLRDSMQVPGTPDFFPNGIAIDEVAANQEIR